MCRASAIGTRAVAITELLIGFSADPMYSGATKRQENGLGRRADGAAEGGEAASVVTRVRIPGPDPLPPNAPAVRSRDQGPLVPRARSCHRLRGPATPDARRSR